VCQTCKKNDVIVSLCAALEQLLKRIIIGTPPTVSVNAMLQCFHTNAFKIVHIHYFLPIVLTMQPSAQCL
jgi:hypothetical protein